MSLQQFWSRSRFSLERPPFIHPDDVPTLSESATGPIDEPVGTFQEFVHGRRFGQLDDHEFHLSLVPVPYAGNLDSADIFILLENPGFWFSDYYDELQRPEFRDALVKNLNQELGASEFPFAYLDPSFCFAGGFKWWEQKLRKVASCIADHVYAGRYLDSLRALSRRVAVVELIPYHSIKFRRHGLVNHLASARAARSYARDHLVPRAREGQITMIVTRKVREWDLGLRPGESHNVVLYKRGQARGASLGPTTPGGKAILRRFGIDCGRTPRSPGRKAV